MASVFTRIISGDIPGRFVWRDDSCVALLTIEPLNPGHTLVVPIEEIDHWIDLPEDLAAHLFRVAHIIARAVNASFSPRRVGLIIAGMEVPHTHIHVVPINRESDLHFANARNAPSEELDRTAAAIRAALQEQGYEPADS